ncbi:MAG: hypothetical protein WD749_04545 [Phycisphaerales bacterium]
MSDPHPRDPDGPFGLLQREDSEALDALVTCGFDGRTAARTIPHGRERIERLQKLLSLLDCDATSDQSLADVTFARMMQARGEVLGAPPRIDSLSPADDEALEALVMAGFDAARVPGALRERARLHKTLADLVTRGGSVEPSADLTDRTLALIQRDIDSRAEALRIDSRRARRSFGIRLPDLVSAAAVLLIGAGVLLPILGTMRESARRTQCLANLGLTAAGMGSYAIGNRDSLPVANASLGGAQWWKVGEPRQSNSANLFTLPREGYVSLEALACPGNARAVTTAPAGARDWRSLEEISYSYQIMFGSQRPAWRQGQMVVLADRSPLIPQFVRGEASDPFANATNHRGAGQHVLHTTGMVSWEKSPVLASGEHIWLPRGLETVVKQVTTNRRVKILQGNELPEAADDTFLGP